MRRWLRFAAAALLVLTCFQTAVVQAAGANDWLRIDPERGAVAVRYDVKADVKTKLMVAKGQEKYTYTLTGTDEVFPLQMGNGEYTVTLLEQLDGNTYQVVDQTALQLAMANETQVYLNAVQNVDWDDQQEAVQLAQQLTAEAKTEMEKLQAIYAYIVENIAYDEQLAKQLPANYIPVLDRTLATQKDICYGYAALLAGMLRAVDIPAKLVMGTADQVDAYHAWNEVYIDGNWVIVDTTVDAVWNKTNEPFTMIKDAAAYNTERVY